MAAHERIRARGISIYRPIVWGNSAYTLTPEERATLSPEKADHTHRWTVSVRSAASLPNQVGGADDISHFIKRVSFKLHETYTNPTRNIDSPPFEVTETGWGEFEITIRITFVQESGEKALLIYHHLKLHPWSAQNGPPELALSVPSMDVDSNLPLGVHSWQYDEVVFNDPVQSFLNLLMQHPPSSLPRVRMRGRPHPPHLMVESSLAAQPQPPPEFTTIMEREEVERIEDARRKVIDETDRIRQTILAKERLLASLKTESS
ncbi:yeats family-domain-containing protein [Auriculariales sp. MPI-PUGE-AT-0066]|nr:yeats family-domain-containing protein [Auriculariales sp. MPI-PUGE-AT-0066]